MCALESQTQRHLNLPRTSNRFVGDTQAAERRADVQSSCGSLVERGVARTQRRGRALLREALEARVLSYIVDRDVEARSVRQVINIEAVFQGSMLCDLRHLHQRDVRTPLPGLPEDLSLIHI